MKTPGTAARPVMTLQMEEGNPFAALTESRKEGDADSGIVDMERPTALRNLLLRLFASITSLPLPSPLHQDAICRRGGAVRARQCHRRPLRGATGQPWSDERVGQPRPYFTIHVLPELLVDSLQSLLMESLCRVKPATSSDQNLQLGYTLAKSNQETIEWIAGPSASTWEPWREARPWACGTYSSNSTPPSASCNGSRLAISCPAR